MKTLHLGLERTPIERHREALDAMLASREFIHTLGDKFKDTCPRTNFVSELIDQSNNAAPMNSNPLPMNLIR